MKIKQTEVLGGSQCSTRKIVAKKNYIKIFSLYLLKIDSSLIRCILTTAFLPSTLLTPPTSQIKFSFEDARKRRANAVTKQTVKTIRKGEVMAHHGNLWTRKM